MNQTEISLALFFTDKGKKKILIGFGVIHSKATNLDGTFPPAWIGYGNAYAAREEGDQAMSVYRTAARLFPGYCVVPLGSSF